MADMNEHVPFYYSQSCDIEEDKKLLEPFKYISQCNEKWSNLSAKLTEAFNHWLKIPADKLQQINDITSIFYNAYILYNDIQDNSTSREGIPVTHSVYGISNTLNTANYAQMIGFEKLLNLHPAAIKIAIQALLDIDRGQGMYIYWRTNFICPTEEDYRIMAIRACSSPIKTPIRLMQLFSTCEKDFSSLTNTLGLYYRILDDYCDIYIEKDSNDKSCGCDDLTEGNFSFPFIHALTNNPDDKQIINILRQRTKTIEIKRHCLKLLEDFGSIKYTRDVLEELDKKLKTEIEHLGGNPFLMKTLDKILKTYV